MIRMSEAVLAGHPDKFCDQVAEAIVAACVEVNPEAYCQVEVSAWSDHVTLTGGLAVGAPDARPRRVDSAQPPAHELASSLSPLQRGEGGRSPGEGQATLDLEQIVHAVAARIGYPQRFQVHDYVCQNPGVDPRQWTRKVNDQSIVIGWAGYDAQTNWLPPEHWLAHRFREAFEIAIHGEVPPLVTAWRADLPPASTPRPARRGKGRLAGEGPDGKLLVRMREEGDRWTLEHLLVTLQQREETKFQDLVSAVDDVLRDEYARLRREDRRWCGAWEDVTLLINPNGPLVSGGTDGDNGQTGRKLVMDFYGPRVPIGGGALAGKHPTHIDRIGAIAARDAALHAVLTGARECRVTIAYAPNEPEPLEVVWEMEGSGERKPIEFFDHDVLRERFASVQIPGSIARRPHVSESELPRDGDDSVDMIT